ncbi:outer membrane beta-barrel protein [Thauera sp.]|uniref:surface lipoprotein assembly modifier n=1 Tax=Thauera sp. TaxID=1905334 RepID=UPI00257EF699|nr:outer membrane beta-barrel protein [Thauera sp.]
MIRPTSPLVAAGARPSIVCLALVCASPLAHAVDAEPILRLDGGLTLTPTVSLSSTYDDNIRARDSGEEASWISSVRPVLAFELPGDKVKSRLSYALDYKRYHASSRDDHTAHFVNAGSDLSFDVRNRLALQLDYSRTQNTAPDQQRVENDRPRQLDVGGTYTYGAPSATGQIRLSARESRLRYDNDTVVDGERLNADLERDSRTLGAAFLYRVAPTVQAVAEVRETSHSYLTEQSRDGDGRDLLLGAEWDVTAKTSGSLRVGRQQRRFDDSSVADRSGTTWALNMTWAPLTYSSFVFALRQAIDEGSDNASAIRARSSSVDWRHEWTGRIASTLGYQHAQRDYVGANTDRNDTTDTYRVGLSYSPRRWMDVGLNYAHTRNDSNRSDQSYSRNTFGVTLTMGF